MTIRIYSRCSSLAQAESELGVQAQLDICQEYCQKHYPGVDVVGYSDLGLSGSLDIFKRPALAEALTAMEKGDILLSYDSSRLARDTFVWLTIEQAVNKAGGKIIMTTGLNGDSLEMQLVRRIMSQLNEYALHKGRERTKNALKVLKDQGIKLGNAPYGFTHSEDRKKFLPVEREQEVIELVKELRKEGGTWAKVVDTVNALGYKNRRGRKWSASVLRRACK